MMTDSKDVSETESDSENVNSNKKSLLAVMSV